MSTKSKVSSLLVDVFNDIKNDIEDANSEKRVEYIVHTIKHNPDAVWSYHHDPEDGIPFGRLEGYWKRDNEPNSALKFIRNRSTNLKLMDYSTFMNNIIPKTHITIYPMEEAFRIGLTVER